MRKFDAGPASATRTSPLRRSWRFAGLTGVGFAQPKRTRLNRTETRGQQPAQRIEVDDRVERQAAEQLRRRVALQVGDRARGRTRGPGTRRAGRSRRVMSCERSGSVESSTQASGSGARGRAYRTGRVAGTAGPAARGPARLTAGRAAPPLGGVSSGVIGRGRAGRASRSSAAAMSSTTAHRAARTSRRGRTAAPATGDATGGVGPERRRSSGARRSSSSSCLASIIAFLKSFASRSIRSRSIPSSDAVRTSRSPNPNIRPKTDSVRTASLIFSSEESVAFLFTTPSAWIDPPVRDHVLLVPVAEDAPQRTTSDAEHEQDEREHAEQLPQHRPSTPDQSLGRTG